MLKPEISLPAGLAVAAVVFSIYSNATPTLAEIRHQEPNDETIESARKQASWLAAGTVGAISLLAKDETIFAIGAGMVIALDWYTRHANAVNPKTGRAGMMGAREAAVEHGIVIDAPMTQTADQNVYV